ncbi:MAG: histidinol-phosphatase HisJ family protein [Bacteroidales bacterium]
MAYFTDYHIHTNFSDGKSAPEEYIAAATGKGLSEMGFSEHLTLTDERDDWSIDTARLPEYIERIKYLARHTRDIAIRTGIEADYFPGKEEEILQYLEKYPFDYVIGSVHYMGAETLDLGREFFEGKDIEKVFEDYFELVGIAAASGLFDIIGHPDMVRLYGHQYQGDPVPLYRKLAVTLKKHDVAFEINTNGMNKPLKNFYPDPQYLHVFAEEGVPLCINSDAHMPSRVAQHFGEAYRLAAAAGFTETAIFRNRERFMIPLEQPQGLTISD